MNRELVAVIDNADGPYIVEQLEDDSVLVTNEAGYGLQVEVNRVDHRSLSWARWGDVDGVPESRKYQTAREVLRTMDDINEKLGGGRAYSEYDD